MRRFGLAAIAADPQILYQGHTHQLHGVNFDPPLPAALAADCREVLRRLAVPDGTPFLIRQFSTDNSRARICNGVLEVVYLEKCFPDIGDRVGDYSIETDTLVVRGGGRKANKAIGARLYVIVQYRVKVQR